jgi:aspartyl-tRNA(Asn)/glutamyl-tRNA(Gln) amidotransferase subunit A
MRGDALGPLHGVPITIKDNVAIGGVPMRNGSLSSVDFVPEHDATVTARVKAAGAVLIGTTTLPEFAHKVLTDSPLYGVTRNPWDLTRTPGGSSGGASAALAAGVAPIAIGTDGGGSIRRPACHTGLVGWKPSAGHIPRIDGFPAILTDFETIGTLTTSVADALLLDAAMAGADPRDRRSLYAAAPRWPDGRRRILYIPRFGGAPVDPEVAAATASVAADLANHGHTVVEEGVFFDLDDAARIWHVISRAGVAWLAAQEGGRRATLVGASARAMAADGDKLTGADYIDALERVAAFRRRVAELFARVDLVLTPTAAALPWPAETPYPDRIAGQPAGPRDHAAFTGFVNIAGLPAISLPVAVSATGLPIGVQLVAGFGADADLLAFAGSFAGRHPAPALPVLG